MGTGAETTMVGRSPHPGVAAGPSWSSTGEPRVL